MDRSFSMRSFILNFPIDAVLLIGPTGVGKSPLGDIISSRGILGRSAHHLDFGRELRTISQNKHSFVNFTTTELDFIQGVLERGLLLENEHFYLARKIITLFLERSQFNHKDLLILNGIPRHTGQSKDISSLAKIHALFVLDSTADTIYRRLQNNIGGDRTERKDDDEKLVAKKLKIFNERTSLLLDYYQSEGASIYRIAVTDSLSPETAFSELLSLSAANPPFSLITKPPQ